MPKCILQVQGESEGDKEYWKKQKWRRKNWCFSEQHRRDKVPKDWLTKNYNTARSRYHKKAETSSNETIRAEVTKGNSMLKEIGKKRKMISNMDEEISNVKKEVETFLNKAIK